jgi:hypothetical protein
MRNPHKDAVTLNTKNWLLLKQKNDLIVTGALTLLIAATLFTQSKLVPIILNTSWIVMNIVRYKYMHNRAKKSYYNWEVTFKALKREE